RLAAACRKGQGWQEEEAVRPLGVAGLVLVWACSRSAADHEELGDRAYAAGEYRNALAEYQLGLKAHPGSADLSAKAGAAALHTGEYALAVAQYVALGQEDRSRAAEAADGLERPGRGPAPARRRQAHRGRGLVSARLGAGLTPGSRARRVPGPG